MLEGERFDRMEQFVVPLAFAPSLLLWNEGAGLRLAVPEKAASTFQTLASENGWLLEPCRQPKPLPATPYPLDPLAFSVFPTLTRGAVLAYPKNILKDILKPEVKE